MVLESVREVFEPAALGPIAFINVFRRINEVLLADRQIFRWNVFRRFILAFPASALGFGRINETRVQRLGTIAIVAS
jgi:hypothetical protein